MVETPEARIRAICSRVDEKRKADLPLTRKEQVVASIASDAQLIDLVMQLTELEKGLHLQSDIAMLNRAVERIKKRL